MIRKIVTKLLHLVFVTFSDVLMNAVSPSGAVRTIGTGELSYFVMDRRDVFPDVGG